jgi:hypothetical protein
MFPASNTPLNAWPSMAWMVLLMTVVTTIDGAHARDKMDSQWRRRQIRWVCHLVAVTILSTRAWIGQVLGSWLNTHDWPGSSFLVRFFNLSNGPLITVLQSSKSATRPS